MELVARIAACAVGLYAARHAVGMERGNGALADSED